MRRPLLLYVENNTNPEEVKFSPLLQSVTLDVADLHIVDNRRLTEIALKKYKFDGAILSGSSENLSQHIDREILTMNSLVMNGLDVPVLGVCFGMQIMAIVYGGTVSRLSTRSIGIRVVKTIQSKLFDGQAIKARHSHGDAVQMLPPHFECVGITDGTIVAFENSRLLRFGVQFHPEANPMNREIIGRFIKVCKQASADSRS